MSSSADKKGFIVNPIYDGVFFIFSPLLALLIGFGVYHTPALRTLSSFAGKAQPISESLIAIVIYAHLVLVFFRSHGNPKIFKTYPYRFTVAPVLLFLACYFNFKILILTSVIGIWWDVYHSGLQTFGLGRIYDMRAGNGAKTGRRLDYFLNLAFYLGPILGGAALMDHVKRFSDLGNPKIQWTFFANIPAMVAPQASLLTKIVLAIGIPFFCYYLWAYWRLHKQGYKVSWQKVALYSITGIVSIVAWGFNSFGQAFLIMNFFHAWQYFAIVWWSEEKNLSSRFGVGELKFGKVLTFTIVFGTAIGFGWVIQSFESGNTFLFAISMVVSIMHFWYDGFIWSVRKKQVPA